jgi:hypothetical protein
VINFFKKHDKIKIISFVVLIVLIVLRLFNKSFYDDEIGSIQIIDRFTSFIDLYFYVNTWDVSPPLSYILFYFGKLLFSYKYVPLILLPIQIICINIFLKYSQRYIENNLLIKNFYKISIICNPIFILWCTSLRWYSLWVPLALSVIGIFYFKRNIKFKDITVILLIVSVMFHLNYLTIIFLLALILSDHKIFINYLLKCRLNVFLLLILNVPQLYFFFTQHLFSSQGQFGDLYYLLIYPFITIFFGNSYLPFEYISIFYFLLILIIFLKNLNNPLFIKSLTNFKKIIIFSLTYVLFLFILKLGHKPRHSIIMNYLFYFFIFFNLTYIKNKVLKNIFLFIFILTILLGNKNNILEENVIKNNINLPIKKILNIINDSNQSCLTKHVFTYNLNLKYYLNNDKTIILNNDQIISPTSLNKKCIYIIKTFIAGDDQFEINIVDKIFNEYKQELKLTTIEYDKFNTLKTYLLSRRIKNQFIVKILYHETDN